MSGIILSLLGESVCIVLKSALKLILTTYIHYGKNKNQTGRKFFNRKRIQTWMKLRFYAFTADMSLW